MNRLQLCIGAAAIAISSQAAAQDPATIRIGWNQSPGHLASLAYLPELQPGGAHSVLENFGGSYIAEPIRFQGSSHQITALATNEVDVAALSSSAFVQAVNNANLDVKVIADVFQESCEPGTFTDGYFVRADSGIDSVKDLVGKRIGTNAIGSSADMSIRSILRSADVADNEVTFVEMPFGQMPAFLREGKVDLVLLLPAFRGGMDESPDYKQLFTNCDAVGPSQQVMLVAKTDYIEKNRDSLVDMMADHMRSLRWYYDKQNRDAALKLLSGVSGAPAENFAGWVFTKDKDQYRNPDLLPTLKGLENVIGRSVAFGILNQGLDGPVEDYVDISIVTDAKKQLDGTQ